MPTTLDGIYDQAMERIQQHPHERIAMRALAWIVYAVRPLQTKEVQHAVAIDELEPEDRSIFEDTLTPPGLIVDACAGIIKIDEESSVIALVHKTTQEYFDRNGTKHFPDAQFDIGKKCLTYLSLEVFSAGPCTTDELWECRLQENALLGYAAHNVGNHVGDHARGRLKEPMLNFLLNRPKVECTTQAVFVTQTTWRSRGHSQNYSRGFHGIHYAAHLGLTEIVELLLATGKVEVESKDEDGRTPLSYAAEGGHKAVVEQLLATGKAEVESKDAYGVTPLSYAAMSGHEAVVEQLLATGKAEVESKDKDGRTPLSYAAEGGHEAVVEQLRSTGPKQ
jgi:hypothetical protein